MQKKNDGKYKGATNSIYYLKYGIPKVTSAIFHNGSNYDYHFVIKRLAKKFEEEFNCLGENTIKYKTFSVIITKKVKKIDKNGREITKTLSYRLQFINSARFMVSSFVNLVDNLVEDIL